MGDVLEAKAELRRCAKKLDEWSRELAKTSKELEPVLEQYNTFIEDFELDLYEQCKDSGERLPSEKMRMTLARKEMPAEFRGKHHRLLSRRDTLKQRISDLKDESDAWRSLLSAEKVELEAIS